MQIGINLSYIKHKSNTSLINLIDYGCYNPDTATHIKGQKSYDEI
jgi:hypothetical protein